MSTNRLSRSRIRTLSLLASAALLLASPAAALTSFPWVPPGSPTFGSAGGSPGDPGGRTWSFTAWNTSEYISMYFGPTFREAGLDGNVHSLTFDNISGQVATWSGTSPYTSPGGPGNLPAGNYVIPISLQVTITGYGATPWALSGTLPGLEALEPGIGAYVDITPGSDFDAQLEFFADLAGGVIGGGNIALNDVAQGPPGGQTQSSIGGGWYGVIPEPGTGTLVGLSIAGLGAWRRRRH